MTNAWVMLSANYSAKIASAWKLCSLVAAGTQITAAAIWFTQRMRKADLRVLFELQLSPLQMQSCVELLNITEVSMRATDLWLYVCGLGAE
jgi:hypothetical protein